MTQDEARARVARGAARLDEKLGHGWAREIDIGKLCIADTDCVLFQLGARRGVGYTKMATWIDGLGECADLGFFVPLNEDHSIENPSWRLLQDEWIQQIADRVVPKGQPEPAPVEQATR